MKAIINVTVYDFMTYQENQYVLFDKKIREVGPMTSFNNAGYELIDGTGSLLMPGLINGHGHIYSTLARGLSVPYNPMNFQEILDQLWWKYDRALDLDGTYYAGIVSAAEYASCGVTTIIDHHASGQSIKNTLWKLKQAVTEDVGLRGIFCFETSDRFDVDACIDENMAFMTSNQTSKARGLFGLHAAMSLSDKTLEKIGGVIGDHPIHIHVAESFLDEQLSMERHNMRVVDRLDRYGLLNENSLLAHCLYVDQEEARIIKDRGCKVVFNISSNMNNGVGLPDYELFKHLGVDVLVGNDGISNSITKEYLNLFYGMHLKYHTPMAFGYDDLNDCIIHTYAYASKILGCQLGRIKEGYEADLLLLPYTPPTPLGGQNALGHMLFGIFSDFKPSDVWCEGKQILSAYKLSESVLNLYQNAQTVSQKVWSRIEGSNI